MQSGSPRRRPPPHQLLLAAVAVAQAVAGAVALLSRLQQPAVLPDEAATVQCQPARVFGLP